jgi:hypothetical protein
LGASDADENLDGALEPTARRSRFLQKDIQPAKQLTDQPQSASARTKAVKRLTLGAASQIFALPHLPARVHQPMLMRNDRVVEPAPFVTTKTRVEGENTDA